MQGYLFRKQNQMLDYWRMFISEELWESQFYVLTNVGILVFKDDNFLNPLRLIPLGKLTMAPVGCKISNRDFLFKLIIEGSEELILGAPDKH